MWKSQHLLGGLLIAALISIVFSNLSSAQDEEFSSIVYDEIDAEATLIEKARLSPRQQDAYQCKCEKRYNDLGFRMPTRCRAYCVGKIAISDLSVEKSGKITFSYPNANDIPLYRETRDIEIVNCRTSNYSWQEKLVIKVVQTITSMATSKLTNTKNWAVELSLGTVLKKVDMKFSSKIGQTAVVETSNNATHVQQETFAIEKPLSVTVLPFTLTKLKYSDGRKDVTIPVRIELVLEGDVVEQHAVVNNHADKVLTGEIAAPDHWSPLGVNEKLSKLIEDDGQRTLTIDAEINVSGSDRNIQIVLLESKLSPDSELCS